MTTNKAPTKKEFLEALNKKGINSLEDLVNAIMPETGGFSYEPAGDSTGLDPETVYHPAAAISDFFKFGFGAAGDVAKKRAPIARTEPF